MPEEAGKNTSLRLISSNGDITYSINVTPANEITTVIWTGAANIGNWGGMTELSWGGYDWSKVTEGTNLTVHFTQDNSSNEWKIRFAMVLG